MDRNTQAACLATLLATLLQVSALATASGGNCGTTSLVDLCMLMGHTPDAALVAATARMCPAEDATMLEVQRAAASLGIDVLGVRAELAELIEDVQGPKILNLRAPEHFLVMSRASAEWVQVIDGGRVIVERRAEIERRYSGYALVLADQGGVPGPKLELVDFHYWFGVAGTGEEVRHSFTVTNGGTEELTLALQSTSCGGPIATIGKDSLGAGESTEILTTTPVTHSGDFYISVQVLSNDLRTPVAFLTVHGAVPHDLIAAPERVRAVAAKGSGLSRAITVSGPAETHVTGVDTERGMLLTQLGEPTVDEDEKKSWTLTVSLKDESFVGEIADTIRIKTTHPERPLITIPVTGVIRGDLRIDPPSAFFGFAKPGAEAKREVVVQSRTGAEFGVTGAECKTAGVSVGAPQQRQDGAWVIRVSVDTAKAGVVDAAITVTTDVKGEETLTIPVYAHVTEGE